MKKEYEKDKTEFKVETNSKQNRKVYIYDFTSHIWRPS